MIYPTGRAIILLALGAPLAVLIAALFPTLWAIGLAWALTISTLLLIDGLLAAQADDIKLIAPDHAEVGKSVEIGLQMGFSGTMQPRRLFASLAANDRISEAGRIDLNLSREPASGQFHGSATLVAARRGIGVIERSWLRWPGPMGLAWRQKMIVHDHEIAIIPDISAIRSQTVQTFLRDSVFGLQARRFRGEGSEFEALTEFQPGMDRRSIDWKVSARHSKLLGKEYDTERNNQIVFALDSGAAMCDPIDGLPRIDRALSAALLTAYVALKSGDRTSLFSFAAQPEVSTPFMSGSRNFHRLQQAAATVDYRYQESNYTLALSTLQNRLKRRSLIIIFADFTDPIAAELMLEAIGRLIERHLVLFVVLKDQELLDFIDKPPRSAADVARAVTAQNLLDQKRLVITRLQHMGIDVIEAAYEDFGTRLINGYLRIKRRGSL